MHLSNKTINYVKRKLDFIRNEANKRGIDNVKNLSKQEQISFFNDVNALWSDFIINENIEHPYPNIAKQFSII